jgi:hypothetical protein
MSAWAEIMRMHVLRLLAALLLSAHSLFAGSNRGQDLRCACAPRPGVREACETGT